MAPLGARVRRAWMPPKGSEDKNVVVYFKLHQDGKISNLRLDRSSGLATADQAALKAVKDTAPFGSLPATTNSIDMQLTFGRNGVSASFNCHAK